MVDGDSFPFAGGVEKHILELDPLVLPLAIGATFELLADIRQWHRVPKVLSRVLPV